MNERKDKMKNVLKAILTFFHLDLTQNMKYDRLTSAIIQRYVKPTDCCVDVGAHKGEILDLFLKAAPTIQHYAFEPIPSFYQNLDLQYSKKCHVYPYALSNEEGQSTFQFVRNAPAYSGIKKRDYAVKTPDIEEIQVEMKRMDEVIPADQPIKMIKIDVEGAELQVLQGAKKLIQTHRPILIFECGKGASEYYGTTPEDVFELLSEEYQLQLATLEQFNSNGKVLSKAAFLDHYEKGSEYYFVAHELIRGL